MYCLANICYVCLEKKNESISNINSSLSVNNDIMHILGYLPFNLAWLKTDQIILICEECCIRLRETYQFFTMCLRNSALLQGYKNNLKSTSKSNTENEAELTVTLDLNNKHEDMNEVESDMKLENEELCRDECGPIIEETEEVYMNLEDSLVKEENTWKREDVDDKEEHPMHDNSAADTDNESALEMSANSSAAGTVTDSVDATNMEELNGAVTKSYTCTTCCKSFITKCDLKKHTRVHTGEKPYKCSRCEQCFTQKSNLVRHTGEKPFECSECDKRFCQQSKLATHMRVHTGDKPYECSICKKCFSLQSILTTHLRTHTGEKPYDCSECGKCFSDQSYLVTHMRVHTGEKPYECSICKNRFSQSSNLATHMRVHTGEKQYECSICKRGFGYKASLVGHMRVHTGEKLYKCSACGKCFSNKLSLTIHMRVHTGEQPYKCSVCPKRFNYQYNLRRHHMRLHTGVEPFKCSICETLFNYNWNLVSHMRTHSAT